MKTCSKCKQSKPVSSYSKSKGKPDGLRYVCKSCDSERRRIHRLTNLDRHKLKDKRYAEDNKEKIKAYQAEYRERKKESISAQRKAYREKNKGKIRHSYQAWKLANREKLSKIRAEYYEKNRSRIIARNSNFRSEARKKDPKVAVADRLRRRIAHSMARRGMVKKSKTCDIIGCSWEELANHIESQFKDGMNWDNRNQWHIDHIIPLASAETVSDVERLNHYTNLQPLWAKENLSKGAKLPEELIK